MRRRGRPPCQDILTPREWEVLSLLREGLTNEQIAARIGTSAAGAKYHVSEILSKLGVARRQEAAAWQRIEEPARRSWTHALRGLLMLKAAGAATIAISAVTLAGLAWAVIQTSGTEDNESLAFDPTPSPTETAVPSPSDTPAPSSAPDVPGLPRVPISDKGVFIADNDGAASRRVANGYSPVWSPDGKRIAYVAGTTGPGETGIDWVQVMDADGTGSHEIGGYDWGQPSAETCAPYGLGSWSLDSSWFAIWTGPGELHDAEIVDVESGQGEPFGGCYSQWLTENRLLFHTPCADDPRQTCIKTFGGNGVTDITVGHLGTVSPTGKWLAVGRGEDLWIRDMETGKEVLLAHIAMTPPGLPDWSPTGLELVISSKGWIYVVSLEDGTIRVVARGSLPRWSPDGMRIAFYDGETGGECGGSLRVADARVGQDIFTVPAARPVFDWGPDGREIVYSQALSVPEGCSRAIVRNLAPTPVPTFSSTPTLTPRPPQSLGTQYNPLHLIPWTDAVQLIVDCAVTYIEDGESRYVWLEFEDQARFPVRVRWHTVEPEEDMARRVAEEAEPACGAIRYAGR